MFSLYRNAARCYVYLWDVTIGGTSHDIGDVPPSRWEASFRRSRWFTRGWTLQELFAPKSVEFFSREGIRLGDKLTLRDIILDITKIPIEALRGDAMDSFTVKERLSWVENRSTGKSEDKAYCMLGIFNVFIPLLYGEGYDAASERLRREIQPNHTKLEDLFSTLPVTNQAAFNSYHNQHDPTCLPDTRSELLQRIQSWVDSPEKSCIFWLNGIASTGKSTVARTIARAYYEHPDSRQRAILGGSFFFSKGGGDRTKADKLATTLAKQLALRVPEARRHICEAIAEQEDIVAQSWRDQWQQLIIGPLSKLGHVRGSSTVLLVIDALDECNEENDIKVIIELLATAKSFTNIRLKIFFTGRPNTPIRYGISKMPDLDREIFVLHETEESLVTRDISRYFEHNLAIIRDEIGYDEDWPGLRIMRQLVEISAGLFIWAATAYRYICDGKQVLAIEKRMKKLINGSFSNNGPDQRLDQIYTAVLQSVAYQDTIDEAEMMEWLELLRQVLGTVVILFSPLSMVPLARLLGRSKQEAKGTLATLHTIFNIPRQEADPVRLHHPTFRDFLLNEKRCTESNFRIDEKQAHKALGDNCIALMSRKLKKNICDLASPSTVTKDIPPARIERSIPLDLQYACLYWVEHYRQSGTVLSDGDPVSTFFKQHFLHWLEVINLLGKSSEMVAIIRSYHSLLRPDRNVRQIPFVKDARRLTFNFQNIIKQMPLQIYHTALIFIPSTNELKAHFHRLRYQGIQHFRIDSKPKDDFNYVSDLAFTPNSQFIASGSNFEAVRFWKASTQSAVRKYEGNATDKMSAIAISPDGKLSLAARMTLQ